MIIDERLSAYINTLAVPLPEPLRQIEKEALAEHVPIIRKDMQSLLRFLLIARKPKNILEIGTAVGFSALLMREAAGIHCRLTTIEKVPKRIQKAKENFRRMGNEAGILLLEGDAAEVLQALAAKKEKYDFIFMDAAKGQYLNFLESVYSLLPPDGMLVTDNVLQDGDIIQSRYAVTRRDRTIHTRMREYLYALTHTKQLETVVLPIGDGAALSIRVNKV